MREGSKIQKKLSFIANIPYYLISTLSVYMDTRKGSIEIVLRVTP